MKSIPMLGLYATFLIVSPTVSFADYPDGQEPFGDPDIEWSDVARDGDGINENYGSSEAKRIAKNVIAFQTDSGGWPKNIDNLHYIFTSSELDQARDESGERGIIDNGATAMELEYLSKVYGAISSGSLKNDIEDTFLGGIQFLIDMQYDNGGFPQSYPNPTGYRAHITYNDDAMVRAMNVLFTFAQGEYEISPSFSEEADARSAYEQGIGAMLATQYVQNGIPTVWGQQHDYQTLLPAQGRSYELPSLSASESRGVFSALETYYRNNRDEDVLDSLAYATKWYAENTIIGHGGPFSQNDDRYPHTPDLECDGFWNDYVDINENAGYEDRWPRMADLSNNKPLFVDRNQVIYGSLNDMPLQCFKDDNNDRRNDYNWYSAKGYDVFQIFGELFGDLLTAEGDVYQAENAVLVSGVAVKSNSAEEGGYYIEFSASGTLRFENVDGGNGGKQFFLARYSLNDKFRRGEYRVNGGDWRNFDVTDGVSDGTSDFQFDTKGVVDLQPGTSNTIEIRSIGDGLANLDAIYIYDHGLDDGGVDLNPDGVYTVVLQSEYNDKYVKRISDDYLAPNVRQSSYLDVDEAHWLTMYRKGSKVYFVHQNKGRYIYAQDSGKGYAVKAGENDLDDHDYFEITEHSDGTWSFKSERSNKYLQYEDGKLWANNRSNSSDRARFRVYGIQSGGVDGYNFSDDRDHVVVIKSLRADNYVKIEGSDDELRPKISRNSPFDVANTHKFIMYKASTDVVYFESIKTDEFVEVKNSDTRYELRANDAGYGSNNRFTINKIDDHTFTLVSERSGKLVELKNGRLQADDTSDNGDDTKFKIYEVLTHE